MSPRVTPSVASNSTYRCAFASESPNTATPRPGAGEIDSISGQQRSSASGKTTTRRFGSSPSDSLRSPATATASWMIFRSNGDIARSFFGSPVWSPRPRPNGRGPRARPGGAPGSRLRRASAWPWSRSSCARPAGSAPAAPQAPRRRRRRARQGWRRRRRRPPGRPPRPCQCRRRGRRCRAAPRCSRRRCPPPLRGSSDRLLRLIFIVFVIPNPVGEVFVRAFDFPASSARSSSESSTSTKSSSSPRRSLPLITLSSS